MAQHKLSSKSPGTLLYTQVVNITHVYLGPAADRFIARQVQNHLHKAPDQLSKSDLQLLIDWIRVAVSLITEDTAIVEEYTGRLERLTITEHRPVKKPRNTKTNAS